MYILFLISKTIELFAEHFLGLCATHPLWHRIDLRLFGAGFGCDSTGDSEGVFGWLAVNYLLGKLGKPYEQTGAMTDMGGGSMQMAYAVSDEVAAKAPEG